MEQKDMYTLEELYDNLPIALSELGRRSTINEVTLARIRDGYAARRSTINKLLDTLSKVYDIRLSLSNVTGILIRDKKAMQGTSEQVPTQPASEMPKDESTKKKESQNRIVERPDNLIPCKVFFEKHSHFSEKFSESSWMRWIKNGIKKRGSEAEIFDVTELPPSGNDGKYFFTPEQALKAVEILKSHGKLQ